MISGGLRTLLLAQSSVTTIVGSAGVHVGRRPQNSVGKSYVRITVTGGSTNPSLDGGSNLLLFADIDFDCYGATERDAGLLAAAVRTFIADYAGPAGGETVRAILLDDHPAYGLIPPQDGSQGEWHVYTVSAQVQYNPA